MNRQIAPNHSGGYVPTTGFGARCYGVKSITPLVVAVSYLKDGPHYISDGQISDLTNEIIAPIEAIMAEDIEESTVSCADAAAGFCLQSSGLYAHKTLVKQAVEYEPGITARVEVVGYCTLCNDGTFSPSRAVGRGACSWHGGVAAYDVARYRSIPDTPEVQAQPAVYSYELKTYKDSPSYIAPQTPSLESILTITD